MRDRSHTEQPLSATGCVYGECELNFKQTLGILRKRSNFALQHTAGWSEALKPRESNVAFCRCFQLKIVTIVFSRMRCEKSSVCSSLHTQLSALSLVVV